MQVIREIISEDQLYQEFDNSHGLIVDVRDPQRRSAFVMEGAKEIDLMSEHFIEFFNDLPKDQPILIYCEDGTRSRIALRLLNEMGFEDLYHLKGGIARWNSNVF